MKRIDIFERTRGGFARERSRPGTVFRVDMVQSLAEKLGGEIVREGPSAVIKIRHNIERSYTHGNIPLEGIYTVSGTPLEVLFPKADFQDSGGPNEHGFARNFLFFDIETTGLSGGAGTHFFLIGMLEIEEEKLVLTQYFLASLSSEPLFLKHVGSHFKRGAVLVSYNGKSFDLNVIKNRFILNGMRFSGSEYAHNEYTPQDSMQKEHSHLEFIPKEYTQRGHVPKGKNVHVECAQHEHTHNEYTPAEYTHLDLLHPSRRLWRGMFSDFSLGTVERMACGVKRINDIPGYRIPEVYSGYLRGGIDLDELSTIFIHNRNDVLSLPALLLKQIQTVQSGMSAGSDAVSCNHLCLSDMLIRCDYKNEAKRVLGFHDEDIEALKRLGIYSKREGSFDEALGYFMSLAERTDELGTYLFSCTEIAKIYEHKLRDFHTALSYVQKADERVRRSLYLYPERELLFSRELKAIEKRKKRLVIKIQKNGTRGVSR
jgi:uncharacterized protein YprB with RNaseH-like and TPR domain